MYEREDMKRKSANLVVGLTGGIATGKTTFSCFFRQLGAHVVSCDELAHRALRKNTQTYRRIVDRFGKDILAAGGRIDRSKLAAVVFKNKAKREALERIVHPFVFDRLRIEIRKARGIIIVEIPLLFETGYQKNIDISLLVWCPKREQKRRLKERDGLTAAQIEKRINAQMPLAEKKRRADYVIDNTDLDQAVRTALHIWQKLEKQYQNKRTKERDIR